MKKNNQSGEILLGTLILGAWFFSLLGLSIGHTVTNAQDKAMVKHAGIDPAIISEEWKEEPKTKLNNEVAPGKIKADEYGDKHVPRLMMRDME